MDDFVPRCVRAWPSAMHHGPCAAKSVLSSALHMLRPVVCVGLFELVFALTLFTPKLSRAGARAHLHVSLVRCTERMLCQHFAATVCKCGRVLSRVCA